MNDTIKTLVFVGLAVVVGGLAFFTRPRLDADESFKELVGRELVAKFDSTRAGSIEIVEFDEENAALKPFTVERKKVKGDKVRWVIPKHFDYLADAQNQLGEVATALEGRKILDVVSHSSGNHRTFGVVDPMSKELKLGDKGVGKRIVIRDQAGNDLVALIIGKALADKPGLRYVRKVDSDLVCVVELDADKISADFEKWIEKDLLKLSGWDLKQVRIDDHSVDFNEGALVQRRRLTLDYNDTGETKWKLARDMEYVPGGMLARGKWKEVPLGENEELDTAKLDGLKNALDELKIVDVQPKPAWLSADLKASGDLQKVDAALQRRGFGIGNAGDGPQVYSNAGEIRAVTKDGVEYVLRLGNDTGEESKKEEDKDGKTDEKKPAGMNRYLLVMAQFNEDAIERPKLEEESKAGEPDKKAAGDKPADAPEGDEAAKAGESDKKAESDKPADAAKGDDAMMADEPKAEEKADEKKDEPKADEKNDEPKKDEPAAEKKDETKADPAEVERIQKENKRKLEEYDEKVKKGKERVKELNDRFADWYYVISNSEFEKIHLGRDQVVKAKEKKDEKKAGDGHEGHDHEGHDDEKSELEKFNEMKSSGPGGD